MCVLVPCLIRLRGANYQLKISPSFASREIIETMEGPLIRIATCVLRVVYTRMQDKHE